MLGGRGYLVLACSLISYAGLYAFVYCDSGGNYTRPKYNIGPPASVPSYTKRDQHSHFLRFKRPKQAPSTYG